VSVQPALTDARHEFVVPTAPKPISLIVLQPTSLCNLNCRYCYVPNRRQAEVMDGRVLEAAIAKALTSPLVQGKIEFLFHAGEPLAAGIDFYRRAADLIAQHNGRNINVVKSIQTNATLIDDAWCDLFVERGYYVGVSIDGPQFLHDRQRVTWAGRGSFDRVLRGVRRLQERDLPFGAICVLSRESLAYPREILDFFVGNGFPSVGFNIEEVENVNTTSTMFSADPKEAHAIEDEFRTFLSRFLELWEEKGRPINIREIHDMALFMLRKQRDPTVRRIPDETDDTGIVTIQKNGDISPYSPEFAGSPSEEYHDFVVGNILTSDFADILTHPVYMKIRTDVHESIARCATSCSYFDLCGGAFLSNKFWQNGTLNSTETVTCRLTRQAVADLLIERWNCSEPK
jgi:uncharacterized protein